MADVPENDKRSSPRVDALVVVQLDEEGRYGVTRDVSKKGLLLATRVPLEVDARLEVSIYGPGGTVQAHARVVRCEKTARTEEWPFRVAMDLDEPLPDEVVQAGTRAAAQLLGRRASDSGTNE